MKSSDWMLPFLFVGAILLGDQTAIVTAIYKDDVGVLDFSVATAGHGAIGLASYVASDLVVTTDVPTRSSPTTSCYVAGRHTTDGSLVWRRNVCSVPNEETQAHAIAFSAGSDSDVFYTVDESGTARAWTTNNGDLLWDARVTRNDNGPPKLFSVEQGDSSYVAVSAGSQIVFLDATTGATVDSVTAPNAKDGQHVEWLSAVSLSSSSNIKLAFARVEDSGIIASGSDFFVGTYEIGGTFKSSAGHLKAKDIVADSVRASATANANQEYHVWAVTTSGSVAHSANGNTEVIQAKDWNESWSIVVGVEATADPSVVRLSGTSHASSSADATMEAFRYDGSSWKSIANSNSNSNSAVALAPALGLVVTAPAGRSVEVHSYPSGEALEIVGDVFGADGDSVTVVSVLERKESVTVLIGTERGSTTLFSVAKGKASGNTVSLKVHWTAEEGLANLSSAIILDASHLGSDDLVEETGVLADRLSMAGRLKAQWQEIGVVLSTANGLLGTGSEKFNYRDHLFGFLKVSALLSSKSHKMWGMSTAGKDRGLIRWSLDLPKTAVWHSMVHGTTNAAKAAHGIHGDTHSREILVLSASPDRVDWMCIDGTSGAINAQDSIPLASPIKIQQVVPVYGSSTGGCRQASLLLGDDRSLTVVPDDAQTNALIQKQLQKTPNGFYTHVIDKAANTVESYRVSNEETNFVARPVGLTSFEGEQIVRVAYPLRHEDMQSMSTILGDNSLLLKYINPHMAVVVTMLSDGDNQSATDVATALEKERNEKPRKPLGAGAPGSSTVPPQGQQDLPNMFVNLVDTVSGRVLYRHSHSGVDPSQKVSVVVSENWVVYTYVNFRTRRTEIGVLTLHEGMIEAKGLTYFARPEQSSSFSSFDARESKPVVLAKVYAFPKAVTALGVTSTRQGISRQNILLASADGALSTINKMILETRRPVGDAKPAEKKEGLIPYKELIPQSPLVSLNYNQTMEPFTSIVSTSTALESQSLVFGFGGPDLFFTRTSPTKGFDLLPETFSKGLVGAATVGIVVALLVVQQMGTKKSLKQGWS